MPDDRAEAFRREAARCTEAAQNTRDPVIREQLIEMAARFHDLANRMDVDDFGAVLSVFTGMQTEQPIQQQQQQEQPANPKKN